MNSFPRVLIIILNWNNYEDTKECLRSLFEKEIYPNKEIIVIDNGSIDGSTQRLQKKFPKCIYIYNKKNLGFAAGSNPGIKYALKNGADYIFLLNNDTIFVEPILEKMIGFMKENKKVGIIGPRLINREGRDQKQQILSFDTTPTKFIIEAFGLHRILFKYLHFSYDKIKNVDYVIGAALLVKKKVVREIGFLDERFFFYAEDNDFCLRARKSGWRVVYFPESKIIHIGAQSGEIKHLLQQYHATFQFFQKYYSPHYFIILKVITSLMSMGRVIIGFWEYIFTGKQSRKIYMKEFLKLSFNIWKIKI